MVDIVVIIKPMGPIQHDVVPVTILFPYCSISLVSLSSNVLIS